MIRDKALPRAVLGPAALTWGAAEAFLFFIVPDVLIGWAALSRGLRAGSRAVRGAIVGAALGGGALFAWSDRAPERALGAVQAVPGVSSAMVETARADVARRGWFFAALTGPASGTPYKVYAALAPQAGANLPLFMLAAAPIRAPRFAVVAVGLAGAGWVLRRRLSTRTLALLYGGAWLLFYGWFFTTHPG